MVPKSIVFELEVIDDCKLCQTDWIVSCDVKLLFLNIWQSSPWLTQWLGNVYILFKKLTIQTGVVIHQSTVTAVFTQFHAPIFLPQQNNRTDCLKTVPTFLYHKLYSSVKEYTNFTNWNLSCSECASNQV